MEEAQLETSKPSEILMGFPRYRRSHLKSETFHTLVRILSDCCNESHLPGANQIHSASQELKNYDNGADRMEQENKEKEPEHLRFTRTDFMDVKDPVSHKEMQVLDTFDGRDFRGEFMMGVDENEGFSGRQDMMICESESVEALPMGANGLNKKQKKIEELNQIVEGTEKLVFDNGLTPLNLGLGEKQSGSSEVELMDYQVEYVEFRGSDINTSGTESELHVEGEFNQHTSEGFHASLIADISTSAKEQTSVSLISTSSIKNERQQEEMELVKPVSAAMVSLPTTEEGEFEKDEQCGQKVHEAMHLSVDEGMKNIEALNLSIKHEAQQKEMELVKPVCDAIVSLPTTEEDQFEKEEQQGQKVHEAMQFSVDQGMTSEASNSSIKHERREKEMELVRPICAAMVSLPATKEGEFEKEEQHGEKVPEVMHFSVDPGMNSEALILSIKHKRQQKEMELVEPVCAAMVSLPATEEGELEKEEQYGQKLPEAMRLSVDQGMNSETLNLTEYGEEISLLDIDMLEAKHGMQHKEEKPEKIICANEATTFSNYPDEEGAAEEGEISGDFGLDDNSFDMSSADSLMIEQRKDEVQNPKHVIGNIVFPFNIQNGEKEDNYESTSFMIHAPQDACNSGQVEPRTSDKNGFPIGVDIGTSREVINYGDLVEHGSVLETGKSEDRDSGIKGAVDLPPVLAYNQVLHRGFLEEKATEDHQNTSVVKKAGINCKKKHGPLTEEKKAKKKEKKRKKRAEKNRKLGVKRLKLHPVQKPKTIAYCRHYLKGRCHEGDKCKFSHDIVPLTKSKPCCHFARHSCMKGDDCPFDHELSKYPCSNFVTRGSCSRGYACMFSHQMPTKQDIPTSSNDSKAVANTKLSTPTNISSSSASQQKHISGSKGIQSHINSEHEVAHTVKKPPTEAPKGISFINVSKSSLPNPGTTKQGMVTPNKESVVQIGTLTDQTASGTALNLENPGKTPVVAPKGVNFLSFGKGRVSSSKSSISSFLNRESGIKLSQKENLGSPEQASLHKNDCSKVGSGTKQSSLQTNLCSNEILKQNHPVAEGMNLDFPGKASIDHYSNDVQFSLTSDQDQSLSRSVQEGVKAYTSQTSTVTSSMLPASPFLTGQSSERLASGHHKHIFNSAHRALLSTLSFAAEHESDIKLKCSAGALAEIRDE